MRILVHEGPLEAEGREFDVIRDQYGRTAIALPDEDFPLSAIVKYEVVETEFLREVD